MEDAKVVSVHVGRIAPLGPEGERSAFVKRPVYGPVVVKTLGLEGDEQADLRSHGGPEKALYGYSADHYAAWRAEFPRHADMFVPGAVGENLAVAGLDEGDICVGDVHAVGTALLQVCQPRQPCYKFALRFDDNRLPKAMVKTGRAGWYYRVLKEGTVAAGDGVGLHQRPNPDFPFMRLVQLVYHGGATPEELERMSTLPGLAGQWQESARENLLRHASGRSTRA